MSGSGDNSTTGSLNKSLQWKANAVKKQQLLILVRMGKRLVFFWFQQYSCFHLALNVITEQSCLCLAPSWSQNGLALPWCSGKLFMSNRRIPRPICECQASSQMRGATVLFLIRKAHSLDRGIFAGSQVQSNSRWTKEIRPQSSGSSQ